MIVSLSVISLDLNGPTHKITSGVKSVANSMFSPLRDSVVDLLSPIGNFFAGALHYHSVQSENEQLQATIGHLRAQAAEKGYNANELRELTALEHLPFLGTLNTVTAQTSAENTSNFSLTITIDKGRDDGVDVGMPVVGAGGLVGQVEQAFHHSSVVLLITDGQSKVGVTIGTKVPALLDGAGADAPMTADLVPLHSPIHKGELVYTSGLDGATFPPGVPVARVSSYHSISGASQEAVTLIPEANMQQLSYVDVVLWEPQT